MTDIDPDLRPLFQLPSLSQPKSPGDDKTLNRRSSDPQPPRTPRQTKPQSRKSMPSLPPSQQCNNSQPLKIVNQDNPETQDEVINPQPNTKYSSSTYTTTLTVATNETQSQPKLATSPPLHDTTFFNQPRMSSEVSDVKRVDSFETLNW